ncbi:MAG: alanine--tRNA ligase, partial [Chitinophagia bacterium]|nr:alanine--tRNA ligase [Chitinophagia bacterium]
MLSASQIRRQFLQFFEGKGHTIVPSAPIVVKNDPTLLFTNAGMNQFKDYFLGNRNPESSRIADTQKCLRVSGKHNDLEEVGVDTYHHTMFEMLGNWSFGDYFKKEAIEWSWELLTEVYKIPKDILYVTVFGGDAKENLPMDQEAYDLWKQFVPEERILHGNKKDNFWEMGDTGPCGPCSEIHVDCRTEAERAAVPGKALVNADHPQVIEIWNNVFMQFNRQKDGSLVPLPAQHVDTGMGLERLVRVLQGKQSNYDTDLFTGTIAQIEQLTGRTYNPATTPADGAAWLQSVAFRVLADHIRAISFTIADGQLPSNTGAGYVIRRILRRAVRYYYTYLDYKSPLLHHIIPFLAGEFKEVFPELQRQQDLVARVIKEEEEAFLRTLDKGLKKIDEIITDTRNRGANVIDGRAAFELFDTYGFPIDLTRLIGAEHGLSVNEEVFQEELQAQKNRSRAATALDTDDWVVLGDSSLSTFVGYEHLVADATVTKYRKVSGKGKTLYQVVLDTTPFYAESGGQVGDTGELLFGDESIQVVDTKKEDGLTIHFTETLPADITLPVLASVDVQRRMNTAVHHSATHLLHAALQEVLGEHVAQKGSLVNQHNLRFDFSHFAKVTDEEIAAIEAIVNARIRENIPVVIQTMKKDDAIAMGAMALFGEKYGNEVRVVIMDRNFSVELCGGTHVGATGELGFFKLVSESAVAAGVRRVEAVSGPAAEQYLNGRLQVLDQVAAALKNPKDPVKAIEKLQEEKQQLEKHLEAMEARILVGIRNELLTHDEMLGDIVFLGQQVQVSSTESLRKLCMDLKNHLNDHVKKKHTLESEKLINYAR